MPSWTKLKKLGFKYRCMKCDEPKKDKGRWVRYLGTACKVCQKCAQNLPKAKRGRK